MGCSVMVMSTNVLPSVRFACGVSVHVVSTLKSARLHSFPLLFNHKD